MAIIHIIIIIILIIIIIIIILIIALGAIHGSPEGKFTPTHNYVTLETLYEYNRRRCQLIFMVEKDEKQWDQGIV
jgi:hypothetical protein